MASSYDQMEVSKCMTNINRWLDYADQPQMSSPCCIYRTPKLLRKVNEAAYTPRLVSIGPFHFQNEDLKKMQNVKVKYLRNYLNRTQRKVEDIVFYIKECKEELKSHFEVGAFSSLRDFLLIMLFDGVFIIELFLRMYYQDVQDGDDIFLQSIDLKNDLFFMQENQLPLVFIEELYNKDVIQPEPHRKPFLELALSICFEFDHVPPPSPWHCPNINVIRDLGVKHLHDLLRTTIIHPCPPHIIHPSLPFDNIRRMLSAQQRLSATVLYEAGVKFKVRICKSFLDIKFDKGKLYMPSFIFDRNTETFVRNLMAYEQCCYQDSTSQTPFCGYFYLMDTLINTSKDVELLVKSGIITNWLGDNDEVATLVNNLFKHVQTDVSQFYYAQLCEDLDGHCKRSWNNWKTTFKRDYLSTPWKVASTFAAIILLFLTLIQTVCSLISLFK